MRRLATTCATAGLTIGLMAACATPATLEQGYVGLEETRPAASADQVRRLYELTWDWPRRTQAIIEAIVKRYGPPQEQSPAALVWIGNGPWKRTTIRNAPDRNSVAMSPKDVLQQVIDYRAPASDFGELVMHDDCLVRARVAAGEIEARCDSEAANFAMVNLAHEIVSGERGYEESRTVYAQTLAAIARGEPPSEPTRYASGLLFSPPRALADAPAARLPGARVAVEPDITSVPQPTLRVRQAIQ